jgi:uncharacterized iron-regulated protein
LIRPAPAARSFARTLAPVLARTLAPMLASSLLLAGCGASAPSVEGPASRGLVVIDTATGARLDLEGLAAALDGVRVVYIGERHDSALDHQLQRDVIDALHARDPSLAIGMEMFQHPFQAPLDEWSRGTLSEDDLLARTEWRERWSLDFALYRPILALAREHGLPVIALNARRELTRAIARDGLESLSPELRAELPELATDDAEHRAMVAEALGGHEGMDPARLERFYLAQLTWDEAMATRVAAIMQGEQAPHRMVVLAGRMHVERGLGIPRRAARRGAAPFRVLLPLEPSELEQAAVLCDYALVVD